MDFKIETIDHYTRNNDMQLINAPPPKLNCQPEERKIRPLYSLTTHEYLDCGKVEEHMESLLQYMRKKGLNEKPNFVTLKQLMASVACGDMKQLFIIPFMGILFLLPKETKSEDESISDELMMKKKESIRKGFQYGGNYHHFMTRKSENEPIPTVRNSFKAVLKTTVEDQSVLYSGEIDALGGIDEHIELKVVSGGALNPWFWLNKSKWVYWQAYFGNVETILVGARTDENGKDLKTGPPHNWPEFSLYKVQSLKREDIPGKKYVEKKPMDENNNDENLWNVKTGMNNIHEFFKSVKEKCTLEDFCYVATSTKSGEDVEWTVESVDENHEDREEVKAFCATLLQILGNDEEKLLKTTNENLAAFFHEDSDDDLGVTHKQKPVKNPKATRTDVKLKKKPMRVMSLDIDSDDDYGLIYKKPEAKKTNKKPMKRGNSRTDDDDEDFGEPSERKLDNRKQYKRNKRMQ
ncbi:hypothetical protein CAEBREN_07147 [Caenorhabditis brenneri]|uniref:Decapping nuclease n=1 Tax=Caenorhabditis brenneri TaxID=135651 RepID=G0NTP7_CAEBE|nr:hypothetical protein CAEBREN_07147 [Caenorhabditis brenneri]